MKSRQWLFQSWVCLASLLAGSTLAISSLVVWLHWQVIFFSSVFLTGDQTKTFEDFISVACAAFVRDDNSAHDSGTQSTWKRRSRLWFSALLGIHWWLRCWTAVMTRTFCRNLFLEPREQRTKVMTVFTNTARALSAACVFACPWLERNILFSGGQEARVNLCPCTHTHTHRKQINCIQDMELEVTAMMSNRFHQTFWLLFLFMCTSWCFIWDFMHSNSPELCFVCVWCFTNPIQSASPACG